MGEGSPLHRQIPGATAGGGQGSRKGWIGGWVERRGRGDQTARNGHRSIEWLARDGHPIGGHELQRSRSFGVAHDAEESRKTC